MEPLRIGVLGAARISGLAIAGPARTTGDRLVAVAARDRSRAEAFAATHGVERVAGSYADVLADPEVEVVYNPLANSLHGPWNLAAVAAGRHVLTEKPSASNTEEAAEVRAATAAAGVTLLEGFITSIIRSPAACWSCWTPASSASSGGSRSTPSSPPPPTATPAGRSSWPAAPSWTSAATPSTPTASSPPGPAAHPASSRPRRRACRPPRRRRMARGRSPVPQRRHRHRPLQHGRRPRPLAFRITGTLGEATAANFVQPHIDDRVFVSTPDGRRVEELGRRSSYTYQLEASGHTCATAPPSPSTPTTRWPTCSSSMTATAPPAFHPDQEPPRCS